MRKKQWWSVAAIVAAVGVNLTVAQVANSQKAAGPVPLQRDLAKRAAVEEQVAVNVLNQLGPAAAAQLAAGREVALPGLGTFRVVRVPEHRDLQDGRPVTVAPRNFVEFVPDVRLDQAANSDKAVPAVVVEPFRYIPLPDQTPGQRVPSGAVTVVENSLTSCCPANHGFSAANHLSKLAECFLPQAQTVRRE